MALWFQYEAFYVEYYPVPCSCVFVELGALTQSHLKSKVTVRQFSGYRKIESINVKTMLLFKVIAGMAIILNSYCGQRYAVVRILKQNYLRRL